ncbi:hypothetical protein SUGI_0579720 [Cryptomeria japonica]|uniref:triacylglycerol lipase OBL1 n=1 Tax=Cryptomeria japonica TaxID=3369 RepID=UPI002414C842|nr:triacylglycerol lipase OBL1 [Cryptomeria japonica]GLJ29405.1 hypothetical protein SUGI_0579720 [Cryptomeria japonica]
METTGDLIAYPERLSLLKLILSVMLPYGLRSHLTKCEDQVILQLNQNWKMKLSLILMKIVGYVAGPLKALGILVEFLLNLFSQNGGLLRTLFSLLNGSMIIPKRGSEEFLSLIGHLERRTDLYKSISKDDLSVMEGGDRVFADISAMASTLAYENKLVIRKRVNQHWKMHFVEFFDFWDDHLQKKSTQAFVLCDKEIDAKLILVAFRGTQLFDADDYITDLDFSWYDYAQIGKVHLGFLEALGLANRSIDKKYSHHLETQDINKPLAYFVLCQKLKTLLQIHKNAKLIVTGHSLGGALAILFSAMLFVNEEDKLLENLLAIYTFGQPRVGDKEFGDFMDSTVNQPTPRYFRVVYSNDLIPRLPFDDGLFKYKHFGVCLYYNCFYHQKNLAEAPNRDLSLLFFIPIRITAIWELLQCLVLHYIRGESFKETTLSIISRIF